MTHARALTVAADAIYVPDYHYSDRSGVILWALINVRLQEFSQLKSTGRLLEDFTLLPRLYSATKVRIMSISCCHVSNTR